MGSMIFLVISMILGGLVIGALGRLVVRGRNPIGFWWTVLCGIGGSIVGGLVAQALFGAPARHRLLTFVREGRAAAALGALVSRGRRSHFV